MSRKKKKQTRQATAVPRGPPRPHTLPMNPRDISFLPLPSHGLVFYFSNVCSHVFFKPAFLRNEHTNRIGNQFLCGKQFV